MEGKKRSCHFEDTELSIPDLKIQLFQLLYEWIKGMEFFSINSHVELLELCILCFPLSFCIFFFIGNKILLRGTTQCTKKILLLLFFLNMIEI